jgi:hypothetical protein
MDLPRTAASVVLDEAGLVEGVGVQGDLDARTVGDRRQASIAAGVVPQSSCSLNPRRRAQLLSQRLRRDGVALAEQRDVHRPVVERLEHAGQVPGARA